MRTFLYLTFAAAILLTAGSTFGQTLPATPKKEPEKQNARPAPKPTAETFDTADVKTMAAKCVRLATEAGDIDVELYPESAPESVRNFLNLTAAGAFDTTTFS